MNASLLSWLIIYAWFNRDDGGDTPLVCASEDQNNTELVELLLKNGADVNPPPGEVRP